MSIKCTVVHIHTHLVRVDGFACMMVFLLLLLYFFCNRQQFKLYFHVCECARSRTKKWDLISDYFPHMQVTADFEQQQKNTDRERESHAFTIFAVYISLLHCSCTIVKISIKNLCVFIQLNIQTMTKRPIDGLCVANSSELIQANSLIRAEPNLIVCVCVCLYFVDLNVYAILPICLTLGALSCSLAHFRSPTPSLSLSLPATNPGAQWIQ